MLYLELTEEEIYDRRETQLQYLLFEGADGEYLRHLVFSFVPKAEDIAFISKNFDVVLGDCITNAITFTLNDAKSNGFLDDDKRLFNQVEFYALGLMVYRLWKLGYVDFNGSEDELMDRCRKVYFES